MALNNVLELAAPSPRVTGGILRAAVGATLPTTAIGAPDTAFKNLGHVGATGVERTEDRSNKEENNWGGDLVAVLQEKYGLQLKFNLLQVMNADVQKAVHGSSNVTVTPATTTSGAELAAKLNSKLLDTGAWIVDGFYNLISMRLVIPIGRITSVGPLKWVHSELASYECTMKPFPDENGNHGYQYWNDGVVTV
ncbi:Phage associated (putative structural protein) [Mycobacteroides abscessus subsp. massiliense]|uniref:hypothetical protein n=1 Tax=Mycobacteroides abscessus TaxID=36809 RepID=UPI0009A5C62D|nr:hypothetical protein [Mycobacteroides abscessus]SKM81013.1 Phage associated (putative structural protein) [Mycobacteroides abscessus subsp. massiliense]SKM97382.1 Phage associated (putative structural protein) [Mycobacteroides abscessus subsp. massiliense]SKN76344.1 Phage associated (putative structural protein) [Mycobacteroides abscessus subsp. massiliense]SKN96774.1 Phage associated (putative structural protein) [Mycobacteroides abscessus subsp. massiliense]SKO21003.1 Phage associated (pu